jgi:hypothetical protein
MSLTIDPTTTDFNEWASDQSMVEDWLFVMWGIVPGVSSRPAQPWGRVHPSSVTTSGWNRLFGFDV